MPAESNRGFQMVWRDTVVWNHKLQAPAQMACEYASNLRTENSTDPGGNRHRKRALKGNSDGGFQQRASGSIGGGDHVPWDGPRRAHVI
jgi:hypothetical protein